MNQAQNKSSLGFMGCGGSKPNSSQNGANLAITIEYSKDLDLLHKARPISNRIITFIKKIQFK